MEYPKLSKAIAYGILRSLLIVLGVVFLIWFLWEVQAILAYIGIAAVISLMGRPFVIFFKDKLHLNDTVAVVITLTMLLSLFSFVIYMIIPVIIEQADNLKEIDVDSLRADLEVLNVQISNYFGIEHMDVVSRVENTTYYREFDFAFVPEFINGLINIFGDLLVAIVAVTFISFFFLKDSSILQEGFLTFAKKGSEGQFLRIFNTTKNLLSRYFLGLILQIFVVFFLYSIILLIVGIENALIIAIFCALLNLIPYIGPLFGGFLMMGFVISDNLGRDFSDIVPLLAYVMLGYVIVQVIDNVVNQPLIFGKSVKSHPLEIFIVILIGGALFGIIGLIAAVPTYTTIKVVSKEFLYEYKIVKQLTKNIRTDLSSAARCRYLSTC